MRSYLLKHRLRHLRSIEINNISAAIRKKSEKIVIPFPACFLALESLKGECLYVSEVQYDFINSVQFNELPALEYSTSRMILKITVKIPEECSFAGAMEPNEWLVLRTFEIDLNKLQSLDPEDQPEGHNVPLFEMTDGFYTLPDQSVLRTTSESNLYSRHRRNASRNIVNQSFSFNSVLKLNIMIDYKAQVQREILETSKKLEKAIDLGGKSDTWLIEILRGYSRDLGTSITRKKAYLRDLRERLERHVDSHDSDRSHSPDGQSLHEYYGSSYSNLIKTKDRVDAMRLKKLNRLITIFQNTSLFEKSVGFIDYNHDACVGTAPYDRLRLRLVDKESVLAMASKTDHEREVVNSCLGYYLLFVQLTATTLFKVPLPYDMKFYGSTSLVGPDCCLYLDENSTIKHPEALFDAIDRFNRNLVQVIQRWEHHLSPRPDSQMSRSGSH